MKNFWKTFWILRLTAFFTNTFAIAWNRNLPWIDIIAREERWANDSIIYNTYPTRAALEAKKQAQADEEERQKEEDPIAYAQKKQEEAEAYAKTATAIANAYLKDNYYEDVAVDATATTYKWNSVAWKQSFKYNKTKIIIHHTAWDNTSMKTQADAIAYLKSMYRYHTLDNWRWDIWYNFIIDPFGNIYEGRAGWEWVVWAHAKRNNTPSIWISLMWNFENVQPTKEMMDSLIKLTAALAEKYDIDPFEVVNYHKDSKTKPYIVTSKNYAIAWHKDAGTTACPWKNVYELLPYVRSWVYAINHWQTRASSESLWLKAQSDYLIEYAAQKSWTENKTTTTISTNNKTKQKVQLTYSYFNSIQNKVSPVTQKLKQEYVIANNISYATNPSQKIKWKISLEKAKNYLNQEIYVLLYELSQNFNEYEIACSDWCTVNYKMLWDATVNTAYTDFAKIVVWENLELQIKWETIYADSITITSNNNIVTVSNYDRKSYAWVPRNTFHWDLLFKKDNIKDKNWNQEYKYVVINGLWFEDYMKWIVETNDTESQTKNEVMALIAKSYALFYMDSQNIHPNIPTNATYNAVDDPDIFQKYVWAWLEKTLTKWYKALETTKNKIVMYENYVPILPYFSCSAGFTYSASEKRWWTDTPYLQNKFDIWICSDSKFSGHGVGLSWQWAERRATKFWWSSTNILNYYYPWIMIVSL